MTMMAIPAHLVVVGAVAVFAVSSVYAATPYIPTTILIPGSTTGTVDTTADTNENSTAYIFAPDDSGGSVALVAVDITSSLDTSALTNAASTLTSGLPFASSSSSNSNSNTSTFVPTLALDGSIVVFSGDCSSGTGSQVWIYNTSASQSSATWVNHQVSSSSSSSGSSSTGPYFLGGGLAFSDVIAPSLSSPSIYAYGGQCPNASLEDDGADDASDWVSAADYTNTMVKLTPSSSSSSSDDGGGYDPETLSLKSQPIAEAGFSFTPLRPSTSNISGAVTQGINAVVLGGHTRSAFVNMSTAAVWSLPEESWSFIAISGPSSSSSDTSELARDDEEDSTTVNSRSGHTAVLNEEGTALVVLGGWVGNTSQAATPQLAVLEMNGSEYGQWAWTVPESQPLTNGEGIYGHGAALLPGNVMMISGGYSISSSSSSPSSSSSGSKLRRRGGVDISPAGGQLLSFLNITSMTWADTYNNPSSTSSSSSAPSSAGSTTTTPAKLGLGLGLGLGVPSLLLLLALVVYCVRRRRRYRHAVRDEHMRNLASGHAFITSEEMLERQHDDKGYHLWGPSSSGAAATARWYYAGGGGHHDHDHDPYLRGEKSLGYESLRGSRGGVMMMSGGDGRGFDEGDHPMAVEPVGGYKTSLRRKPVPRVAKGLYQPTGGGVDESRALGAIHPILEDEEDDDDDDEMSAHGAMSPDKELEGGGGCGEDDPFMTPASSPVREERGRGGGVGGSSAYYSTTTTRHGRGDGSPGPSSPMEPRTPVQPQHPEVQDWVTDIDASDALITARIQQQQQPRSMAAATSSSSSSAATTVRNANVGKATPPPTRRQSLREDDGGGGGGGGIVAASRTDSNLSESNRSAFSFMPSRADSLRVAVAAAVGGAPAWLTTTTTTTSNNQDNNNYNNHNNKRGGTSHSDHSTSSVSNSNTSYTTAKSISALQAEGPTLLLGRPRAISDIYDVADDYRHPADGDDTQPGSPSKSKPPRRSWFGSLRRVFSNGYGSSSSDGSSGGGARSDRTDSPARGESSDYERLGLGGLGLGGIGLLQKRRQGRSAWDTTGGGEAGGAGAALRGRSGDDGLWEEEEDDWDIERAVEQRLVQVMFSVPKERLRIVNGDPEILSLAESAVVVDLDGSNGGVGAVAGTIHHHDDNSNLDLEENPLSPIQEDEKTLEIRKQRGGGDQVAIRLVEDPPPQIFEENNNNNSNSNSNSKNNDDDDDDDVIETRRHDETTPATRQVTPSKRPVLLLKVPPKDAGGGASEASGSPRLIRDLTPSPGVPMTAEEVRFERPRSRVLAMVEQLEGRSRSNSPSPSLSPVKSVGS